MSDESKKSSYQSDIPIPTYTNECFIEVCSLYRYDKLEDIIEHLQQPFLWGRHDLSRVKHDTGVQVFSNIFRPFPVFSAWFDLILPSNNIHITQMPNILKSREKYTNTYNWIKINCQVEKVLCITEAA